MKFDYKEHIEAFWFGLGCVFIFGILFLIYVEINHEPPPMHNPYNECLQTVLHKGEIEDAEQMCKHLR